MKKQTKKNTRATRPPISDRSNAAVSRVTAQPTRASATSATEVGRTTYVGSSRVRQSTRASATPTGTIGTHITRPHVQPTPSPTTTPAATETTDAQSASRGRAAMSANDSGGGSGSRAGLLTGSVASTVASPSPPMRSGSASSGSTSGIRAISLGTSRPPRPDTTAATSTASTVEFTSGP